MLTSLAFFTGFLWKSVAHKEIGRLAANSSTANIALEESSTLPPFQNFNIQFRARKRLSSAVGFHFPEIEKKVIPALVPNKPLSPNNQLPMNLEVEHFLISELLLYVGKQIGTGSDATLYL